MTYDTSEPNKTSIFNMYSIFIYEVTKIQILCHFLSHSAIHCTKFSLDGLQVFSAGDDCTVRQWDIASESEIFQAKDHEVLNIDQLEVV